jgi:hypothetical protein
VAPVGVGTADPSDVEAPPTDPNSLAGLLGRPPAEPGPWTRSMRLGLLALPPLLLVMGTALRRDARRVAMAGPDEPTAASSGKTERVPAGSFD